MADLTPVVAAGEREVDILLRFLNKMRDALVRTTAGLAEDQLRLSGVISGTNLIGIVQHLTGVEEHWFQLVFLGADISPNESMEVPASTPSSEVVLAYRAACARSDDIISATPDLSTLAAIANPGEDSRASLRRITVHMIEETARHAGHADILREQIDGSTDL